MMPPTSIDGTDITGATIDGTDVTEITVDGQTVFTAGPDIPDNAIYYEGEQVFSITGGWNEGADNNTNNFALNSNHILTQGTGRGGRTQGETNNQVDLTGVSLIRVEFSMPQRGTTLAEAGIYVASNAAERIFDVSTAARFDSTNANWPANYSRTEFTLDVTGISGTRHVGVYGGSAASGHTGTTEVRTFSVVLD